MRTIFMLAAANTRKGKTHLISLIGLVFIAALFLNLGLLFFSNLGKFYVERAEAQNGAHGIVILESSAYEQSDKEYFEDYPGVEEVQTEEVMMLGEVDFLYGSDTMTRSISLYNFEEERSVSKFQFIGAHLAADANSIYLPYTLQAGGYSLGDEIVLTYKDEDYSFTVAGFVEDVYFGTTLSGLMDMYMPDSAYRRFVNTLNDNSLFSQAISVRMNDAGDAAQMIADYNDYVSGRAGDASEAVDAYSDISEMQYYRTMIPNMISSILVAFSAIIVAVCLIVVRFRIITNIQDGMTNIGILKAMGYTGGQIVASIVLQFGGIIAVSSLIGILTSFFVTPVVSGAFAGLIGLAWEQGFDPVISGISFTVITGAVVIVSVLSAGRAGRLHPIAALRGDGAARTFKYNFFPLDKTHADLQVVLALKSIFQKLKQNVMIALILMGVSFTTMFSIVMYYNFVVDNTAFLGLGMGEPSNVAAYTEEYNEGVLGRIERMPEVKKAVYSETEYTNAVTTVGREKIYPVAMEDYSVSDNTMVVEGRYPENPEEIAFPGILANRYGKIIGDEVTLKISDTEEEYTICGLTQSLNNGGRMAAVTLDGMKRMLPEFEMREISILLNEHEDPEAFIDILEDEMGEAISDTMNVDAMMDSQMGTFVNMTVLLSMVVIITSVLVVTLVLYLIIKTNISQKRKELGIQKAVGFTTAQLMHQISMGFMPVILIGAALGGLLSLVAVNSVLAVLFGTMGIMKMNFIIRISWAVAVTLIVTGFSYGIAMFIAWRIRKISAYGMVSE